jgi:N-methylhydantoinase A
MAWRVGVDSGGTFTDVCLFDDTSGRVEVWKVNSTVDDPSLGIATGVAEAIARVGASPDAIGWFGHGTTVATNALIQHRGARTGLITTGGFRDLLEIGRQKRPDLYDLMIDKPVPLVTRDLRLEVPERLRHDGSVEIALDETAFRHAARVLRAANVQSVAVCFLYGFINTAHEDTASRILQEEFPEAFACVSHDVAPEFREFERLSTTVVNAYLGPVMRGYIQRLGERLHTSGIRATPHLTQSNGGVISFEQAERLPVRTVLSSHSTWAEHPRMSHYSAVGNAGCPVRRRSTAIPSKRQCLTFTRSAPAEAQSHTSTAASSKSVPVAPAPILGRLVTIWAIPNLPSQTPIFCLACLIHDICWAAG